MSYGNRFSGDPRWITARFNSAGACGHRIQTGERVFWYPRTRDVFCPVCSEARSAEFEAAAFDEAVYNGSF